MMTPAPWRRRAAISRIMPAQRRRRGAPIATGRRRRRGAPVAMRGRRCRTEIGVKGRRRSGSPVTPRRRRRSGAKTGAARPGTERRRGGAPIAARRRRGRPKAGAARSVSEGRRPAVEPRSRARAGRGGQRQSGQRRERQNCVFPVGKFHVNTSFKGFRSAERVWESGTLAIAPRIFALHSYFSASMGSSSEALAAG